MSFSLYVPSSFSTPLRYICWRHWIIYNVKLSQSLDCADCIIVTHIILPSVFAIISSWIQRLHQTEVPLFWYNYFKVEVCSSGETECLILYCDLLLIFNAYILSFIRSYKPITPLFIYWDTSIKGNSVFPIIMVLWHRCRKGRTNTWSLPYIYQPSK